MTIETLGSGDFGGDAVDGDIIHAGAPPVIAADETPPVDTGSISDGFHTFDELYEHRTALFALLCRCFPSLSWRSLAHHPEDLPMYAGFFVAGMSLGGKQVTYHILLERWDLFHDVPELPHAPKWDGHTPDDVVERINAWWRLIP